jgi:hypothetical protein
MGQRKGAWWPWRVNEIDSREFSPKLAEMRNIPIFRGGEEQKSGAFRF